MADDYTGNSSSVDDPNHELNTYLDEIRNAGMKVTNQWKEMWLTAVRYAWGQQLADLDPQENWNYIVINRIYPLMFQNIAKLAKNNPKVLAFARSDEQEGAAEFAEKWAGILQHIWESPYELDMRLKLILGLLDAALFGYMVGKTYWDPQVKYDAVNRQYIGNVRETFVHPANFWADPAAESLDTAENCGTKRRVTLEWAQRRWPEFAEQIEKEAFAAGDAKYTEGETLVYQNQKGSTLNVPKLKFSKLVALIEKHGYRQTDETDAEETKQRYVWVEEAYFKDEETRHVKNEDLISPDVLQAKGVVMEEPTSGLYLDPETGEEFEDWDKHKQVIEEYDEPVYPNGRFVLRIGKVILNPGEAAQQYKGSRWPFTVMPYHILPHMWQGGNAVEMGRNSNDMLNLTVSTLIQRTRLTADPERIVEAGALAKDRKGKIRQKNPFGLGKYIIAAKGKIDKIRNLEYAKLDPSTMMLAQIVKQDIDDSLFMQDVARGAGGAAGGINAQKGKMSATEAARLDTNSHDYTAMQAIFLDRFIDKTLTLIAEIVQRNYDEGRIIRMRGNNEDSGTMAVTPKFLSVEVDVNIEPGSTLPFDEEKKKNDYMVAYKLLAESMPNPLLEDMLRILNISNRKKVLAKHQGTMLFQQFVALSQQIAQADPTQVQAMVQAIPELKPVFDLLMQAAQLQPQAAGAALDDVT